MFTKSAQQTNSRALGNQQTHNVPVQKKALPKADTSHILTGSQAPVQMQAPSTQPATAPATSDRFTVGPPTRPSIAHDNGFLDAFDEVNNTGDPKFRERDPEWSDRARLMKWYAMLEGSEALRADLVDANAAYRHFLEGDGADRTINYERYIENDSSGSAMLTGVINYAKRHAQVLCPDNSSTNITSEAFSTGSGNPFPFAYPDTENWQKAIGGHNIWLSAAVTCDASGATKQYTMRLTVHMEDRYNFNPGQADMATGIPDSDNGIFEVTGLGHQYMNFGSVTRTVTWTGAASSPGTTTDEDSSRNRRPADNRRLRNRI